MCGFFAIVFDKDREDLGRILYEAGKRLSYRGYDSAGMVTLDSNNRFDLRKDAGEIEELEKRLGFTQMRGKRGIVQLRWATFGFPNQNNSQPHTDCEEKLFGAHNGNIINTKFLREELKSKNHIIKGENDGEIILHLFEEELRKKKPLLKAAYDVYRRLKGDYAYVITERENNHFLAVKQGASLFLGIGDGFHCVSSDLVAILSLTRNIKLLEDGEVVYFTPTLHQIYRIDDTEREIKKRVFVPNFSATEVNKEGYRHFMEKEIEEIPKKAKVLISYLPKAEKIDKIISILKNSERIYMTGAGSSFHALLLGAYYFNQLSGTHVYTSYASEFIERFESQFSKKDVVILVSQSGETKDVKNVLDVIQEKAYIISLVNNIGSTIAVNSKLVLPITSDMEMAVPATKTFINQCISFLYLAMRLGEEKGFLGSKITKREFVNIPYILEEIFLKSRAEMKKVGDYLKKHKDGYILGYGIMYPIALEAALKMKEVVYAHYEGIYSGEFKHGPISRVEEGYPVVFFSSVRDKHFILSHMNEAITRKAKVLTIGADDRELKAHSDYYISIPVHNPYIVPIASIIPFYRIVYDIAVSLGYNPDRPRNISKTITVD